MKKMILFIFFLILIFQVYSQRKNYSSSVFDGVTFIPIQGANVYNLNSKQYTFTDNNGNFTIFVDINDTLIISKSIYRQIVTVISRKNLEIINDEYYLFYKAILLKEVKVMSLNPNYEQFKKDLAQMKLPDIYNKMEGIELSEEDKMNAEYSTKGPNLLRNTALSSPITYLYNSFSKKAKMKQLYSEMLQYEEEIDKVPAKYNREIVTEITGLKGDNLMEFMVFCKFSYYDIIRWSQQEIVNAIKYKYSEYQYYKAVSDE